MLPFVAISFANLIRTQDLQIGSITWVTPVGSVESPGALKGEGEEGQKEA